VIITRDRVLAALSRHVGKVNGRTIEKLTAEITGEPASTERDERRVRKIVSELREQGIAVCAHPATGYFIAENAGELEDCCLFLRERALHSLRLESRLRKITLPELLGQLRIET